MFEINNFYCIIIYLENRMDGIEYYLRCIWFFGIYEEKGGGNRWYYFKFNKLVYFFFLVLVNGNL